MDAMKQVKVSDLSGVALDWAVCECIGMVFDQHGGYDPIGTYHEPTAPSSMWAQGGPIIEREEIEIQVIPACRDPARWPECSPGDTWCANIAPPDIDFIRCGGPTPLAAAMRCYVAARLGMVVSVPAALVTDAG